MPWKWSLYPKSDRCIDINHSEPPTNFPWPTDRGVYWWYCPSCDERSNNVYVCDGP